MILVFINMPPTNTVMNILDFIIEETNVWYNDSRSKAELHNVIIERWTI